MVLKSKLIGSCVQSDINLTQSDVRLDWNWVYQKRGWFFLPTRLLSAASGPSDPWPGRTRNRQSGSYKSRGGDLRDLNTCSLALQRRVALTMAETTSGWQWQRTTRPSLAIPASWIFNNYWRVWTKRGFLYYLTYISFNVVTCLTAHLIWACLIFSISIWRRINSYQNH